jgi:hypothetical protein
MSVTLGEILDAIESTLAASSGLTRTQSYDELTEGMNDLPTLQVYPEAGEQDPSGDGRTDRTAFGGGVRQTEFTIHADLYARQRSHLGEDMAALVDLIDAMQDVFEQQNTKPYFGLEGIRAFHWSWRRVVFTYGDPQLGYMGARFVLTVRVF